MNLREIMEIAAEKYPGDFLEGVSPDGQVLEIIAERMGDTLALFLMRELQDVYDPEAESEQQIEESLRAVNQAICDLMNVRHAFEQRLPVRR